MTKLALFLLLLVSPLAGNVAASADDEIPVRQRAMDVLILNDGTRLLGVLPSRETGDDGQLPDTTRLLLRTAWMKEHAPQILANTQPIPAALDANLPAVTLESLLSQHVAELQQQPDASPERVGFLQQRLAELQRPPVDANTVESRLLVLTVSNDIIRRTLQQTANVRQLGFLGIVNDMENVESLSQREVNQKLRLIPVANRLHALPDDNHQFPEEQFERLLAAADSLFGKTCRLIRFEDEFIPDQPGDDRDLAGLAMKMLSKQTQSQLQQLLDEALNGKTPAQQPQQDESTWTSEELPDAARKIAEDQNADIVQVSQMALGMTAGVATVRVCLFHRNRSTGEWKSAVCVTETAFAKDVSEEEAQQLVDNPQLKPMLALFEKLGASPADISRALSMGAVVRIAQQKTETSLQEFIRAATTVGAATPEVAARQLTSLPK
ncbi:MAG: hypothetical protein R3C19_20310 [Planctomycetaceae bacterium]